MSADSKAIHVKVEITDRVVRERLEWMHTERERWLKQQNEGVFQVRAREALAAYPSQRALYDWLTP